MLGSQNSRPHGVTGSSSGGSSAASSVALKKLVEETAVAASGFVVAIRRSLNNELTSSAADSIFLFTFNGPSLSPISLSSSSCSSFPWSKKLSMLIIHRMQDRKLMILRLFFMRQIKPAWSIWTTKQAPVRSQSLLTKSLLQREREKRFQAEFSSRLSTCSHACRDLLALLSSPQTLSLSRKFS